MAAIDILIVNEGELAVVANHDGDVASCLERVEIQCVITTLGSRGCCAKSGDNIILQRGLTVQAVDTTAAGDTFCGVLVAALHQKQSLETALQRANAAGALACTNRGAQTSIPSRADVELFLKDYEPDDETQDEALKQYCGFLPKNTLIE
jgi:ribokinase